MTKKACVDLKYSVSSPWFTKLVTTYSQRYVLYLKSMHDAKYLRYLLLLRKSFGYKADPERQNDVVNQVFSSTGIVDVYLFF